MKCNPDLDDYIEQDITVPPLQDNYFDFVPAFAINSTNYRVGLAI